MPQDHHEEQSMSTREAVFPANRHALYQEHRYSAAIRSGDLLFVSGQVGSRDDGSPEPDFEKQVRLAFANLKAVLTAAGCTFDDVVDVTTFHTDPQAQFDTVMAVRTAEIGEVPYPNWTAVGVTWLAGFDFEIKAIARIPAAA
ncbi:RidA family protein [Sphingomonas sp. 1P08PE]|uniref:RidA family protein n=1 Tax=Sphingomonas sp. 1P08PE TaxID=554122 RepID=UPI0039A02BC2